jgi:hypothetical protein
MLKFMKTLYLLHVTVMRQWSLHTSTEKDGKKMLNEQALTEFQKDNRRKVKNEK